MSSRLLVCASCESNLIVEMSLTLLNRLVERIVNTTSKGEIYPFKLHIYRVSSAYHPIKTWSV